MQLNLLHKLPKLCFSQIQKVHQATSSKFESQLQTKSEYASFVLAHLSMPCAKSSEDGCKLRHERCLPKNVTTTVHIN